MIRAPYMEWSKSRPRGAFDLAASGIRPVTTAELVGGDTRAADLFALSGPNDNGYAPLLEAIARFEQVETNRVACAAGTSGANALAMLALLRAGDEALIETPVYDPLLAVATFAGARVHRVERRHSLRFQLDPAEIEAAITSSTRLIVLSNPHNPTGAVLDAGTLHAIGRAAGRVGAVVLVDEVYRAARVADAPACPAAAQLDGPFLVTNSLTKAWGLAGLRVGWAVADAETAERIRRMRDLVDVIGSFPAEQLGLRAFEQLDALTARTSAILREQWPLVATGLARCDAIDFVPPEGGMMVFPWFRDGRSADLFVDRLRREHDTLVVPGSFFEAASHFRLSFGGPREVVAKGLEHVVSVANSL